ncbi:Threonine/homoserine/homoserine lactone efflux protein [Oscillibacter sp. PC13]|uniref:LysE family transporter n=1 Tax=Oscillibacter sp. PC13 TaxID=1855299 RepID=UPI0008E9597A|nr:LysE family transporter [Oscillibacter sp. PC13]SFP21012.1 Threonine/homoserine/homoserine lactone efflux protein [Oscillibacter sp. PC13]
MLFPWFQFLTYAFATAVTPGPNTLASMSNGGRLGFRRALPFNFGILVGFSVVMLACTILCGTVSALIPKIRVPMLVIGAAYMLHLAWKTWRSGSLAEESHSGSGFRDGLLLQFVNPKIYIYGIVSMESYVLPVYQGQTAVLAGFALLLAFIGFALTLCWSAFGSAFRLLFSKYARVTNTVMALVLVWCAISLFL